uniref:hypothetical protein n=1 Tax=Acetatifactor sp. TaxID=1872090 RepID=UPI004056C3C3
MAKNFGKFLLFTAAVGTAAAAAYYYVRKKETADMNVQDDDEDYDDFCEDLDDDTNASSRNYVALNREAQPVSEENTASSQEEATAEAAPAEKTATPESVFTPLADKVAHVTKSVEEKLEKTVEEFFDEESTDEEPPITDN